MFPRRMWNELNHDIQFAYHPSYGTLGTVTDANGVRTRRIHDDLGRLRAVLPDGGARVTIDYALSPADDAKRVTGHRISVRDETGAAELVRYDAWDRPILEARRGFGGEWIYRKTGYDALGHVSVQTRPSRMLPSGMGGRSITPAWVENTIATGTRSTQIVEGVERTVFTSGNVQVVTEQGGQIVVTVMRIGGR